MLKHACSTSRLGLESMARACLHIIIGKVVEDIVSLHCSPALIFVPKDEVYPQMQIGRHVRALQRISQLLHKICCVARPARQVHVTHLDTCSITRWCSQQTTPATLRESSCRQSDTQHLGAPCSQPVAAGAMALQMRQLGSQAHHFKTHRQETAVE